MQRASHRDVEGDGERGVFAGAAGALRGGAGVAAAQGGEMRCRWKGRRKEIERAKV